MTIKGEDSVYLWQGDEYTDQGAIAIDNQDGNITPLIKTDNPVDTQISGEYKIVYTVSDASGNESMAERWVIVEAAKVYHGYIKADNSETGLPEYMNDVLMHIVNGDPESYSISTLTIADNRPTGNGQNGYFSFRLPEYGRPYAFMAVKMVISVNHLIQKNILIWKQTQMFTYRHRCWFRTNRYV
ncbi:MAG: hypothetical protein OMM_15305, partial [Candidatus Magnetoglobus multicellularis str. Araruama]